MHRFLLATILVIPPGPGTPPPSHPHLVVFIAVDQLRGDYLERYRNEWTGGFRQILDHGAVFPNARQDHGVTETAPGHSTMLSGRTPSHTGIVNNSLGVQDSASPLVESTGPGASPRRFVGTTLADWMRAADSGTRVLSVSRKDRGAILPVGRGPGEVYWYSGVQFTTSQYYADHLPSWVLSFNARRGPQNLAGTNWDLLRPPGQYREMDSMPFEHGGADFVFPHRLPSDSAAAALQMPDFPWMDSLTLDFALDGVRVMGLGTDSATDLLSISLSTTDAVGHAYGPDSRELHDQLLRLDHWLGWFLDSLSQSVPPSQTVFAISSDHGVQSFPEFARQYRQQDGGRVSLADLVRQLGRDLQARYQSRFELQFESGLLTADVAGMRARGINVDSLAEALAVIARGRRGVTRILTPALLASARDSDQVARLWRRDIPAAQGWLLAGTLKGGFMWSDSDGWTTHGSLAADDMSIPIAFWGAGVKSGIFRRTVSSVDIAPTLAALVGVAPTEALDGQVLHEVKGER
ncbi:MAG: alkaline phosphatase family protein [Gemmatimonadota bacterium]